MTKTFDLLLVLGEPMLELRNHSHTNIIYCSPFNSPNAHKTLQYEIGTELGVAVLLLQYLYAEDMLNDMSNNVSPNKDIKSEKNNIKQMLLDIDMGYVVSESNMSEEELEDISSAFNKAINPAIYLGSALLNHSHSALIKEIFYVLSNNTNITILPNNVLPNTNTLHTKEILKNLESLPEHNEAMIFISNKKTPLDLHNPSAHLITPIDSSPISTESKKTSILYASKAFMQLTKLKENELIILDVAGVRVTCKVMISKNMRGIIAILEHTHINGYPFISVKMLPPSASKPSAKITPMRAV